MSHPPEPRVSVVIPTYNRGDLLRHQLELLTRQDFPLDRLEIVVADDGSSDGTADVVSSFTDRLRLSYHFQPDEGFRAAAVRNAGARLATAPLLIFLDTGSLVGPGFVTEHVAAHERPGPAGPGGGRVVLGYTYGYNPYNPYPGLAEAIRSAPPEEVVRLHRGQDAFQDLRHAELAEIDFDLSRLVAPWMHLWTLNMSLRAADYWAAGGFDEDFRSWGGEDLEFGFRVHRLGVPLTVSREAWALESPHERDLDSNRESNCANSWLLWEKHPEPIMEVYAAQYSRNEYDPPLEHEYRQVLDWYAGVRDLDVADEITAAVRDTPGDPLRVLVLGAGGRPPVAPEGRDVAWTLLEADDDLLAGAVAGGATGLRAIGLRTVLEPGSADLIVITSRLRGLWPRWSAALLAEADRIGGTLRVAFTESVAAR